MSVGNALLDSDHRILIDLLNQLQDATETGQSREVVGTVLAVLVEYAEHHFRREEALLAASGMPGVPDHHRQHRALEQRARGLLDRYRSGERGALDEEVVVLLKRWLTEHILVSDKSYRPWIEKLGAGADAAPLGSRGASSG